jgi:aminoglycoside 3-N-acetyltransferase I
MDHLTIRTLKPDEVNTFIDLIKIFESVFQMKDFQVPDILHLGRILSNDSFKVVIAEDGNKVIGGATIYTLDQYYSTQSLAYIYDLAIRQEFQRIGIGKKIIVYIKEYYHDKRVEEVFVQADEVDEYALDFYRSTNPTAEEKVRHFYYSI